MNSIHTLLNRIIDYAGLFPPAKLDMAATVKNYARYLHSAHGWMLGRLIVPVARLEEFEHHAAALLPRDENDETDAWQISALTADAGTAEFESDLNIISNFNLQHENPSAGLAIIDMIEIKADSAEMIDRSLDDIPNDLFAFFEIGIENDPRGLIAALVDGEAGAKVRTGGVTAQAYPSAANLARFIAACAAANVPFKATAGLHHPLRHFSSALSTKEFGFLNVFLAGCFAQTHEMAVPELTDLLEEQSPEALRFDEDQIAWRDFVIHAENIEDVREEFAISFGSCSVDEPVADLRAMKLL